MLDIIYSPRCVACGGHVESDYGLCGTCWRQVHFMRGTGCWTCGLSLPGYLDVSEQVICDSCLSLGPPWRRGVAALAYDETGRSLVLALKHGDRHDIVRPAADWMAQVSRVLVQPNMLVALTHITGRAGKIRILTSSLFLHRKNPVSYTHLTLPTKA